MTNIGVIDVLSRECNVTSLRAKHSTTRYTIESCGWHFKLGIPLNKNYLKFGIQWICRFIEYDLINNKRCIHHYHDEEVIIEFDESVCQRMDL